jgi:hypothetical protein
LQVDPVSGTLEPTRPVGLFNHYDEKISDHFVPVTAFAITKLRAYSAGTSVKNTKLSKI